MDRYHSIIFNKVTNPIWHESIKVDLPPSMMQQCHLFFTFRNFGKLKLMDDSPENIFAFAFLPLVQGQNVMIQNASHCLTLYKYQESLARPDIYLSFSAGPNIIVPVHLSASSITTISDGADALSKLPALEHTLTVITSVFSSFITQDIHLSNLINWKRTGAFNRSPMKEVLLNFQNVGEMEIVNFSRPLFHSFIDMFNEMDSTQGGKLFDIVVPVQEDVFQCFTFYLGIMLDKRFTPQLKRLLEDLNNHSSYKYPLQKLVESCIAVVGQVESLKGGKLFRKFVRVWHLVVSCIVTSCHKDPSIVDSFCQSLLTSIGSIFTIASHDHVLASQSLAMQKLGMLVTTFKESTTVTFSLMKSVMNSIDRTIATLEVLKLRLIADLIKNQVFDNVLMEMDDLRDYGLNMALPEDDNIPETGGVYESLLSARVMVCMYILKGLNGLDDSKISASLCRKLLLFNLRLFLQLKSKNEIEWKPLDVNQVVRSATITQRPVSAPESNKFDLSTTVQNNLSLIIAFPKCLSLEDLTNVLKPLLYDESFLSDFLHAAWLILDRSPWEESWITLNVESIRSLVTYLNVILSLYPESYRSRDFSNATVIKTHQDIWRVFVEVLTKYMGSSILHLESFSYQKARFFQTTVGDLRLDLAKLLQRALNTIEMLEENYKLGLTVPHTVIQELFTLYLQPKNTLKTSLLELISECSRMEYQKSGNLKIIENSFYHSLHCLILSGVDKSDVKFIHDMEDYFRDSSMTSLLKPVFKNLVKFYPLCVQQYEIESAANGDQISTTVRTLRFLRHVRQKDLFVQYVQKLHRMHLEIGNLIEAAFVLKQQASLLKWRSDVLMDENQSLGFPSYLSEFELHESIYLECIRLLDDGGAWERAIELTRELEYQYEHMTFEYTKLSQLLKYRVILYDKIVECDRTFPNYFRVAFYGQGFQNKLSGKQFIFKGENWEKLDAFCDRMERLYSPVTIISTKGSIDPSIISTSGRVLQINLVDSVPDIRIWSKSDPSMLRGPLGQVNWDIDSKIKNVVPADGEIPMWLFVPELQWDDLEIQQLLRKKDSLPLHLTSYYENNELTMFALNRPLRKTMPAIENHPAQEILEVWNEKTIFFIENSLPYLSRQSRVVQTVTFQTSPIENAIICIRTKTRELLEYERKYSPLADEHHVNPSTESGGNKNVKRPIVIEKIPLNINPFSMALSGAVDAAVNGGIALYKSAFLSAYDLEQAHLQQTLEKAILEQVEVIDRCIKIHKVLVPREMYPLHEHIVKCKYTVLNF
ncbi:dedicator of cytokinesis-domain-containing protein [Globomyces pollinis-pini]|nr:dedicator of cytokinesis-domain-containing protein [Globomyces pollinis-pini]